MGLFGCFSAGDAGPAAHPQAVTDLEQKLSAAQTQIQGLSSQLAQSQAQVAAAQAAARAVPAPAQVPPAPTQQDAQAGAALQQLQAQLAQCQAELQSYQGQLKTAQVEAENQAFRATALEQDKARLQADHSQLAGELQALQQAHAEQQAKLEQAASELAAAQAKVQHSAQAIDTLYKDTASFVQQQNGAAVTPAEAVGSAGLSAGPVSPTDVGPLATAPRAVPAVPGPGVTAALNQELDELQAVVKALRGREFELEDTAESLRKEVERLQLEKHSLQQAYDTAFDEGQEAREEVARLEADLAEARAQMEQLTKTDKAGGAEAGAHLAAAQASLDKSLAHAASLEKQLASLTQENERLATELKTAQQAAQAAEQSAASLRGEVGSLQAHVPVAAEAAGLRQQLQEAVAAREAAEREVTRLRSELESHTLAAEGTAGQVGMLMQEINTLKKRCAELDGRLRTKDELMGVLEQELAQVTELELDSVVTAAVARQAAPLPLPAKRTSFQQVRQ